MDDIINVTNRIGVYDGGCRSLGAIGLPPSQLILLQPFRVWKFSYSGLYSFSSCNIYSRQVTCFRVIKKGSSPALVATFSFTFNL
jgi:hypothetical protein